MGTENNNEGDISPKTLLVLVVLVLVVSFIGAWVSLSQVVGPASFAPQRSSDGTTVAKVGFSIKAQPEPVVTTGEVKLEITAPPE